MRKLISVFSLIVLAGAITTLVFLALSAVMPKLNTLVIVLAILTVLDSLTLLILMLAQKQTNFLWAPIIAIFISALAAYFVLGAQHQKHLAVVKDTAQEDSSPPQSFPQPSPHVVAKENESSSVENTAPPPSEPSPPEEASSETSSENLTEGETPGNIEKPVVRGGASTVRPAGETDPAVSAWQQQFNELTQNIATMKREDLWKRIAELRASAPESEQRPILVAQLDNIIIAALENAAAPRLKMAREHFATGQYDKTIEETRAIMDMFHDPTVPRLTTSRPVEPAALATARALFNEATSRKYLLEHPEARFVIRGFLKTPKGSTVPLEDLLTGDKKILGIRDSLGEFQIDAIDEKAGTVTVSKGTQTFEIKK